MAIGGSGACKRALGPWTTSVEPRTNFLRLKDLGPLTRQPSWRRALFIPYPKHYTGPMTTTTKPPLPAHPIDGAASRPTKDNALRLSASRPASVLTGRAIGVSPKPGVRWNVSGPRSLGPGGAGCMVGGPPVHGPRRASHGSRPPIPSMGGRLRSASRRPGHGRRLTGRSGTL